MLSIANDAGLYHAEFALQGASAITVNSQSTLSAGQWHLVAATVDTTKLISLYVDGSLVASVYHSIFNWTPPGGDANLQLTIGAAYPYGQGWAGGPGDAFGGKLDNVQLYTHALSPEAIAELARAQWDTGN